MVFFCNFRLQRTFQEWIAPKLDETDQDNSHIKFLRAFRGPTLNDLEIQQAGFSDFFAISGYDAHFSSGLRQNYCS